MTGRYDCIRRWQPGAICEDDITVRSCSEQGVKIKISAGSELLVLKGEHIRNEKGEILQHVCLQKVADRIIWIDKEKKWVAIVEMKRGYSGSLTDIQEKFKETGLHTARILTECGEKFHQFQCILLLVHIHLSQEFIKKLAGRPYVHILGKKCVIHRCKHEKNSFWELSENFIRE